MLVAQALVHGRHRVGPEHLREFTATQADDLYELVSDRAERSVVITANRQAQDWYSLFPNPVVAESILDRLVNRAHHVHMDGKSYRPKQRPGNLVKRASR